MKNEGITILQIVITIVIMIILATIAVFYAQGVPSEARIATIYNEVKEIKSSIVEARMLNKMKVKGDTLDFYGEVTVPKVDADAYETVLGDNRTGEYYYLDFTSSRKLENTLELENVNHDYLLDFNTLNIYLIKGIEIKSGDTISVKYDANEIEEYYYHTFKK
ncbi:MAG: hypothetical protein IJ220_06905 [Clostridia bacterium]|nr:hypothetical protein [Clostridia bacterium]